MLFWILKIIFFLPSLIVYPVRVVGRKNLPKEGRLILSANHQTLNDPIIVGLKLIRRFHYMGKAPLFKNKLFAWFLKKMGAYPVHTSSSDINAVKNTLQLLNKDKALCIFPEGARLKTSESNELKSGVALFALKTKSPIVPAHFVRKTNAFVPNTLIIGKPFHLSEMEEFKGKKIDKDLLKEASKVISKHIHKLKTEYRNKNKKKKNKKVKKEINAS